LCKSSKISLAFHLFFEPKVSVKGGEFHDERVLESLGAGRLILGERPLRQMVSEMFHWCNALAESLDASSAAVERIDTVLSDAAFIHQMCRRHDWRQRIRKIYEHFELSLPERLKAELVALDDLANSRGSTENHLRVIF